MTDLIPALNILPSSVEPIQVEFFDPPMCCPTGLCGPTLDQTLLDVDEMIFALQTEGIRVERYQMTSYPNAFLGNAEVMSLVREKQYDLFDADCPSMPAGAQLPLVLVNGEVTINSGKIDMPVIRRKVESVLNVHEIQAISEEYAN